MPTYPDVWAGCFRQGWQGQLCPSAFEHRARFSYSLIFRIVAHAKAEGWLAPGDTVLDPFGGVACGALPCLLEGINWIGVELEPHYITRGEANLAYWQQRHGHRMQGAHGRLIHGDSRHLRALLSSVMASLISSPPYADGCRHTGGADPHPEHIAGSKETLERYSLNPANLGNLPGGLITSPPYAGNYKHDSLLTPDRATRARDVKRGYAQGMGCFRGSETYGPSSGNLGNMPDNQMGSLQGETFWTAAQTILAQSYTCLRPGGVALFVTKAYVRHGQVVDFPGHWARLCEHVGFRVLHVHHALLGTVHGTEQTLFGETITRETRKVSFFRALAEKQGAPRIDFEVVHCLRKESR